MVSDPSAPITLLLIALALVVKISNYIRLISDLADFTQDKQRNHLTLMDGMKFLFTNNLKPSHKFQQ